MSGSKPDPTGGQSSSASSGTHDAFHFLRPVWLTQQAEALIGAAIATSQLPAMLRVRLLGTATNPANHQTILSNGLMPRSMLQTASGGLTPPIKDFASDALRRIYLGGFVSTSVYSNIAAAAEQNPDWIKLTKSYRFQCAFLFRPTLNLIKFPILTIVPETLFARNFMNDDKSIVKIMQKKYFGLGPTMTIPGAYKSVEDFVLKPNYFIGSPSFSLRAVLYESMTGSVVNAARLFRGLTVFSIGTAIVVDARKRFIDDGDDA